MANVIKSLFIIIMEVFKELFNKYLQVSDEEVVEMVTELTHLMEWMGYEVTIETEPDAETKAGANVTEELAKYIGGIAGITKPFEKKVTFYIGNLKKALNFFFFLNSRKLVKACVRHENRHVQQFEYLREIGGEWSVQKAMFNERFSLYGTSPLEKDALDYQSGKVNNLDEVMISYL